MKPVNFKEVNKVYAASQPEYNPLPAFKAEGAEGEVITCWELSFKERLRLLITGKIWVDYFTFGNLVQPTFITTKKEEVIVYVDENGNVIKEEKKLWWEYPYGLILEAQYYMENLKENKKGFWTKFL